MWFTVVAALSRDPGKTLALTSRKFLIFSRIEKRYLICDCTSKYLEMTVKYLAEEAVYSLYTSR
jgi:hypothetical protein